MSPRPQDPAASWFSRFDLKASAKWPEAPDLAWQSAQSDGTWGSPQNKLPYLRTYRTFLSARALLAVVLLGLLAGNWLMGNRSLIWIGTAVGYASLALLLWAWPSSMRHQRTSGQAEHVLGVAGQQPETQRCGQPHAAYTSGQSSQQNRNQSHGSM